MPTSIIHVSNDEPVLYYVPIDNVGRYVGSNYLQMSFCLCWHILRMVILGHRDYLLTLYIIDLDIYL